MRRASVSKAIGGVTGLEFARHVSTLSEEKQGKLLVFLKYLAGQSAGVMAVDKGIETDWEATKKRVALVARVLKLPDSEVKTALKYNGRTVKYLCGFSLRYNLSLNWLILGDTGSLCYDLAWAEGWRPADWTPDMERIDQAARKSAKRHYLPKLTKARARKKAA